jgi:hypothetical protein
MIQNGYGEKWGRKCSKRHWHRQADRGKIGVLGGIRRGNQIPGRTLPERRPGERSIGQGESWPGANGWARHVMRGNGGSCQLSRMSHERRRRSASAINGFRGEPEPMTTRAGDPSLIRRLTAGVSLPGLELSRSTTYPRSLHIRLRSRAVRFFVACSGCDSQPREGQCPSLHTIACRRREVLVTPSI